VNLTLAPEEGSVQPDEPLAAHTTWKIGGPARWFCQVRSEAALARVLGAAAAGSLPLALLGMGSNILVADAGFPGAVVRLEGDFLRVAIEGEYLSAGGGAALGAVCAAAARAFLVLRSRPCWADAVMKTAHRRQTLSPNKIVPLTIFFIDFLTCYCFLK